MRKLILQMQTSVDGFVSSAAPGLDWLLWNWGDEWPWDDALKRDFNAIIASAGCILLSGNMAEEGYLDHWGGIARRHAGDPDYAFAAKIVAVQKAVISSKLRESKWERTTLLRGELATAVGGLKAGSGGDIFVFGGARFASALINAGLVDEYQFFVNPRALGAGYSLFQNTLAPQSLKLIRSQAYPSGMIVNRYAPERHSDPE